MALNWTMVSEDGTRPIPLPQEKFFHSVEKCSISLEFKAPSLKWSAPGAAFVTNQRIIFVRLPPIQSPSSNSELSTLSVPLSNFVDTRYLIPIFAAPHYEAAIIGAPEGGLPTSSSGLLKIWFNEGGGMAFRDAIEEVKSRREEGAREFEALPTYEPPAPAFGSQAAVSLAGAPPQAPHSTSTSTSLSSDQGRTTVFSPTSPSHEGDEGRGRPSPATQDSLPSQEDLEAANIAREHEERERDQLRRRAMSNSATGSNLTPSFPSHIASHDTQTHSNELEEINDEPPAYEA